jgi:hypothetical protein
MTERVARLIHTIRAYYEGLAIDDAAVKREVDHALSTTAALDPVAPSGNRVNAGAVKHLPGALDAARRGPGRAVAEAIDAAKGDLLWYYGYAPRPGEKDLSQDIAFCEILGPTTGSFRSTEARLGFTLIGPRTHYPAHSHPAAELYHLLAGPSIWIKAGAASHKEPGDFILHPSGVSHAMETDDASLLSIYSWSGDILSRSTYLA